MMRKWIEKYRSQSRGVQIVVAIGLVLVLLLLNAMVPWVAGQIESAHLAKELEAHLQNGELHQCGFVLRIDGEFETVPELTDEEWKSYISDIAVKPLTDSDVLAENRKPFVLSMEVRSANGITPADKGYYNEIVDCRFLEDSSEFLIYYKGDIFLGTSQRINELISQITWTE